MKFRKIQMLSFFLVATFVLSMHSIGVQNSTTAQESIFNFELTFETYSARSWESVGFYYQQALAPLGIDVQIVIKPWGQFVGDLLRLSTGETWDLATVWFTDGGSTPNYDVLYSTTFPGGFAFTWGHDDPDFQAQLLEESGLNQTEDVDKLLNEMRFVFDPLKRHEMLHTFQDWYMNHLLYDYPNFARVDRVSMWKGFGGENNELWDTNEGILQSRKLGASWDPAIFSDERRGNATTYRQAEPAPQGVLFDPYQIRDTPSGEFAWRSSEPVFEFDKGVNPHPNQVLQWFVEDWDHDSDPSTPMITNGKHTLIFDTQDWYFSETTDKNGVTIPKHAIDANDYAFTMALTQMALEDANLDEPVLNMEWSPLAQYAGVSHWNVKTTATQDDTLELYYDVSAPDDFEFVGGVYLLPEHILNGTITDAASENTYQTLSGDFNPQLSEEWAHWTTPEGNSLAGEYQIVDFEISAEGFYSFRARDDMPFNNEWDTAELYNTYQTEMDALGATLNTTGWATTDLSVWAPHRNPTSPAYYWAYKGDGVQVTEDPFQVIETDIIEDTNALLIAFESGEIDAFTSSLLGQQKANDHDANPDLVVKNSIPATGPLLMYMNMKNEHIMKYDVRRAMAHAIDRQKIVDIHDGFGRPWGSPVGQYWQTVVPTEFIGAGPNGEDLNYVTLEHEIPYDYEAARDLMRANGYQARDSAAPEDEPPAPPVTKIVSTVAGLLNVGNEALIFLSAFSLIAVVSIRRFRKY